MSAMQKTKMSADELLAMVDDGFRYELVRGELVKMPPAGFDHGRIGGTVYRSLSQHVFRTGLGETPISDTGYQLADDHVLAPDVSFVSASRVPSTGPPIGFFRGAPDMAVEVVSPSESEARVSRKTADYLLYGCKMVVVVRPRSQSVEVHMPGKETVTLESGDVLDGGDAVPGWRMEVSEIFG